MREFSFQCELWLPRPPAEVFPFFADAWNLEKITPEWLRFEILSSAPLVMRAGALINYRLRLHGIPVRWCTQIAEWDPPRRFVDIQLKGPYRLWRHTHLFQEIEGGTLCLDQVQYRPRGGIVLDRLFVRRSIQRIFAFRQARLKEYFPRKANCLSSPPDID